MYSFSWVPAKGASLFTLEAYLCEAGYCPLQWNGSQTQIGSVVSHHLC